jgi:hypothetical protein
MGKMLTDLISAGLVTKLDGHDDRLGKINRAADVLAKALRKDRQLLIPAVLTGLNANATINDVMMLKAEQALQSEWATVATVHTDQPLSLYRALLLDACQQAGIGANAAVIWYTAADTLTFSPLDREATPVREMLQEMARRAEEAAVASAVPPESSESRPTSSSPKKAASDIESSRVDREDFELQISAALGASRRDGKALTNPNRHWPHHNPQEWIYDAAPRLQEAISEQLDELAGAHEEQMTQLEARTVQQLQSIKKTAQQAITKVRDASPAERQRLDTLWWLESLYSTSLHCSYRELDNELAAVTMAYDLLSHVSGVMPASLPYLLAEGINRLPGASFREKVSIATLLYSLNKQRIRLPAEWFKGVKPSVPDARFSLRDLVVAALLNDAPDIDSLLCRAAIAPATEMSLPEFGRAVLRQEHAVRLAATKQ